MKTIFITAFLLSGVASAGVLTAHDRASLGVAVAYALLQSTAPGPAPPAPEPKPAPEGEVCPECNGRGKRGDGTVDFVCENCGGTGRVKSAPAPAAPLTNTVKAERYAVPPKDGRTYRRVCRDGVCAWEPVP